jgi:hypothetical protein
MAHRWVGLAALVLGTGVLAAFDTEQVLRMAGPDRTFRSHQIRHQ